MIKKFKKQDKKSLLKSAKLTKQQLIEPAKETGKLKSKEAKLTETNGKNHNIESKPSSNPNKLKITKKPKK